LQSCTAEHSEAKLFSARHRVINALPTRATRRRRRKCKVATLPIAMAQHSSTIRPLRSWRFRNSPAKWHTFSSTTGWRSSTRNGRTSSRLLRRSPTPMCGITSGCGRMFMPNPTVWRGLRRRFASTRRCFGRLWKLALDLAKERALGPVKSWIVTTEGGVRINERMEALDARGAVIPGLYAAGSNGMGGIVVWGHGLHIAWALTSGRLAGRNAAES
jgi:hypothetical protein